MLFDLYHFLCSYFQFRSLIFTVIKNQDPGQLTYKKLKPVSVNERSSDSGERGGSVVECRTPEREVRGSRPTAAVLCPWARHFTPRKYWLITQEAMAPSRHDWKIVDWDVKPQHNQPKSSDSLSGLVWFNPNMPSGLFRLPKWMSSIPMLGVHLTNMCLASY